MNELDNLIAKIYEDRLNEKINPRAPPQRAHGRKKEMILARPLAEPARLAR